MRLRDRSYYKCMQFGVLVFLERERVRERERERERKSVGASECIEEIET